MHGSARSLLWLAMVALAAGADDQPAIALRQHNTAALQARGLDRALIVRDRTLATVPERSTELLVFCRQRGITALFLDAEYLPGVRSLTDTREYGWRRLLGQAHQQGLRVYALIGNTSWVANTGVGLDRLDAIAALGGRNAPGEGFDGVLIDLPILSQLQKLLPPAENTLPPTEEALVNGDTPRPPRVTTPGGETAIELPTSPSPELYPARNKNLMEVADVADLDLLRRHLDLLWKLRRHLLERYPTQRLACGVTLPAWLRTPLGYNGEMKHAGDHFADAVDFVVAHNYPLETTAIGEAATALLRYGGQTGKPVLLRLELSLPLRSTPTLISLASRDELFLETVVSDLLTRYGQTAGFGGVALDDYLSYRRLPAVLELPRSTFGDRDRGPWHSRR